MESYVVAPDRGKGVNDITSPCSAFNQLEWRLSDRTSWGNIVDADGNKVLYLLERPVHQSYDEPERLWMHDGCILLDGDKYVQFPCYCCFCFPPPTFSKKYANSYSSNPVRPWAGVPRCFSSMVEGGRMEALRRILPMTIQDFRARMLRSVPTSAGLGAVTKPLSFPSTFGHRSSRFRNQYQCPAWLLRAASAVLRKQVTDLLPEAEEATTTEGLQALSRYEMERRKSSTRGNYLYKAAGRAISEEERKRRERKLNEKLEHQAVRQPETPQRPQSMSAIPWQSASPSPYLPTPPLSADDKRGREDDGLEYFDIDQSGPAVKRGRFGVSPLDPRLQDRLTTLEDLFPQAPNSYDTSSNASTMDTLYGQPEPNAIGLGLNFGEQAPNSYTASGNASTIDTPYGQPEPRLDLNFGDHPQQTEAAYTDFTNAFPGEENAQIDYRFVVPQNSLERLSIQAALSYPRTHYYALMGAYPPHTSEGSYGHQFLQILTLLEKKWAGPDEVPILADVGPWHGSFNMVPRPDLPDGVLEIMLHPPNGLLPPAPEVSTQEVGAEDVQTASNAYTGPAQEPLWNDDMFAEYLDGSDGADGMEQ